MSLLSSMNAGTSGMQSASAELSVVSDNIANSNTVGFKAGRAAFEDVLSSSVGGTETGLGSRLSGIQKMFMQGALTSTGVSTDLALQGNGMFVLKGSQGGQTGTFYSRAGQFTVDKDGYMVNLQGLKVQGFLADQSGQITSSSSDLLVGNASATPKATSAITVKANLQADATTPAAAWDPTDPSSTSNFSTSLTVYDSLGTAHQVQAFFRKTGTGAWDWHALTDGSGVAGGTAGTASEIASGTLSFDTSGKLTAVTQTSSFNPAGASGPQALSFNFGDPTGAGGTGLAGITQFSAASATTFLGQDGYASGQLASIQVDATGTVTGVFSNGQSRPLGQVAVASFTAQDQLARVGGNLFTGTLAAGTPVIGTPGQGGRATITSGALEQSNVDLADQFVRMISAQRAFEANSKTITTTDQLLSELIQSKR
ncbi:flagellar hook protein FlgE [Anaeromyxobacter paludicola]|uniref:Flagellar hook protein FlgE n=1 Tax=Anaeromyxobacter paludicola TaxID=2918171 RepID=A0ABM7X802_9BACT|nr:flagellar hook protein FlgE [Anaeromyxobacter paludicola]BDG07975.1 flagellar hook protein FlgE [Anaeromyxobacter paludicola]